MFCQSSALEDYCARLADFPLLSDLEQLKNDMVCETVKEIIQGSVPVAFRARNSLSATGDLFDQATLIFFFSLFPIIFFKKKRKTNILRNSFVEH